MANRFPLIVDSVNENIKELPSGDNLDLTGNDALFGTNDKAIFGAGSDLEIYHDGSNSRILENGTGFLAIGTNGGEISLRGDSFNDYMLKAEQNSAVTLYHNALPKLATASTGIDVTGTVTADGLTVDGTATITTTGNETQLTLTSTDADANIGPRMDLHRDSASPANNDLIGDIRYLGENDASEVIEYANIESKILDVTDGAEDGLMDLRTIVAGTSRSRITILSDETVVNDGGQDLDFRVESDTNTHALFVDAGSSEVGINTSTPGGALDVRTANNGRLLVDLWGSQKQYYNDNIVSELNWTGSGDSWFKQYTNISNVNSLYNSFSGSGAIFNEDGADRDFRVESASNDHMLFVDAGNNVVGINTSENQSAFALNVVGTAASGGRVAKLSGPDVNTSTSTAAPQFVIENSNSTTNNISGLAFASSNGGTTAFIGAQNTNHTTHSGDLYIATRGPNNGYLNKVAIRDSDMIINDSGVNYDFRVESDSNTHMLFVDGGYNAVGIGKSVVGGGSGASEVEGNLVIAATAQTAVLFNGGADYAGLKIKGGASNIQGGADDFDITIRPNYSLGVATGGDKSVIKFNNPGGGQFETVFNEDSYDADFRVESNNSTHMLFVDAGNDAIRINNQNVVAYAQTLAVGGDKAEFNATQWASFSGAEDGSGMLAQNLYRSFDGSTIKTKYVNTHASIGGAGVLVGAGWNTGKLVVTNIAGTAGAEATTLQNSLTWQNGSVIVNDDSNDIDFRVESTSNTHALFVDAGNSRIGINDSSPSYTVDVLQNTNNATDGINLQPNNATQNMQYSFLGMTSSYFTEFVVDSADSGTVSYRYFKFYEGTRDTAGELLYLGYNGTVFNEGSADRDFRVESDSNTHMLFVDGGQNNVNIGTSTNLGGVLNVDGDATNVAFSYGNTVPNNPLHTAFYGNTTGIGMHPSTAGILLAGDLPANRLLEVGGFSGGTVSHANWVTSFTVNATEVIANDGGGDIDFRVESDNNANMFVVNAADSTVGIGTNPSTNYRTLTVVNALDTNNSAMHIHGGNAGLYIGESYTGGYGYNAAIARALVAGYHISSSLVGDLCIGAETGAGIRFGTQASGLGNTNRMYISENGAVSIAGSLSKGSGSFNIDHPLPAKSATHNLVHSFVEAPQADNIYRGKVDLVSGQASVNIDTIAGMTDGTFAALNREIQCFTSNETGWTAVRGSVSGNTLTIEAQDNTCTDTVSWLVIGERQDQHMYDTDWTDDNGKVIVEPLKTVEE